MMQAKLLALAAIALWSLLAWLGLQLAHVPPFLLTGIALLVGSRIVGAAMLGAQAPTFKSK
jgi:hypothetical protein